MTRSFRSHPTSGLLAVALSAVVLAGCGLAGNNSKITAPTTIKKTATSTVATVFPTLPPTQTTTVPVSAAPAPGGAAVTLPVGAPNTVPPSGVTQPPGATGQKYIVKSGDIPSTIAKAMGVSVSALLDANGLTLKSFITVGQQLVMPAGGVMPPGGTDPNGAPAGGGTKTTSVPTTAATGGAAAPGASKYTVVANDSWYGIAKKFGVSADSLLAANKATTATLITPGQVIVIPGKTPAVTTTVKA